MSDVTRTQSAKRIALFTGAGGAASESIHRQWQDRYDLRFADADPATIPPSIPAERRVAIPRADAADFVETLAGICESLGVDVLLPGVDEELPLMPALFQRLPSLAILVPPAEFVRLMMDKLSCADALRAHGIDSPATVTSDHADAMTFPCIAKPRTGRGSRNVMVLDHRDQVAAYQTLFAPRAQDTVLQQLISGTEYTVYVSGDAQGRLRDIVPVKVLQKRGVTIRAEIDMAEPVVRYCEAIHAAFQPSGPYNVQLMLTHDGKPYAFEINPRVSTTFCLAIAADADPIADRFSTEPPAPRPAVPRLTLQRNWLNAITRRD